MMRSHWFTTAAVLVLAPAALADAPSSPLAQVPATAAMVVHINGPDTLDNHVAAFLKNVAPDQMAAGLRGWQLWKDGVTDGMKLSGLARGGCIFLVFTDAKIFDNEPRLSVVAAVSDYAAFRDNLLTPEQRKTLKSEGGYESAALDHGRMCYFVDRKNYAVCAPTKETAEMFVKGAPGLDGKLSKEQADRFLRSDVGVYVDGEALKEYADELKLLWAMLQDGVDVAEMNASKLQKEQWEALRAAIDLASQAIDDGGIALLTGELRPEGAAGHAEATIKPDSKTAESLKESKPSAFRDLRRMPAGQMFYTARQAGPVLTKLLGPLEYRLAIDPDLDGAKAAREALARRDQAGPRSHVQAVGLPAGGAEIWEYDDPQKAVAAQTALLESLEAGDWFLYGLLKGKPEVRTKVVRYHDMEMSYARLTFDWDRMLADVPQPAHRLMVGGLRKIAGDGVGVWFGTDGKRLVEATGQDWFAAKRLLDPYFTSDGVVGRDDAFTAVRRELPAEASAMIVIDAVQCMGALFDFLRPLDDASGGQTPKLPTIKGKPAFVGASLTLRPDRVEGDLFVSADAVQQLYKPLGPWLELLLP